jgi:hypothetical protein
MAFDTRIRNAFRSTMAQSLLDDFDALSPSRYFLFFGKNTEWENENRPNLVVDCVRSDLDAWLDMMGCIRIGRSDVCLVIPRNQWQSGVVYTQYDDSINLANPFSPKQFYVCTSENKVYKCISNGNDSPSTVQPTSTSTSTFCTSDGYRWKFMYQIPDDLYYKFATDTKIPVEFVEEGFGFSGGTSNVRSLQLAVQNSAVPGSIENVILESLGDSFPFTSIALNQYVSAPAYIGATEVLINPAGLRISQANSLVGYSIYFSEGMGAGQICEILGSEFVGGLLKLTLKDPLIRPISSVSEEASGVSRTGFQLLPTAKVYGDGTGCQLLCKMEEVTGANCDVTYQIEDIQILRGGKNYTNATIRVGPAVRRPVVRAVISPPGGHGSNAVTELGNSELMIFCSTRAGIAGDLPSINNFRQFGLIRNPLIGRGDLVGQLAGTADIDGYRLRISKPEVIVVKIKFSSSAVADRHTYTAIGGDFKPGQLVSQVGGAKGIVVRWLPPVSVSQGECCDSVTGGDPTGYLYLEPIDDSVFINDSTKAISGLDANGQYIGPQYNWFQEDDNFVPTLGYTDETFDAGKFIVGVESLATARIIGWEVGPLGIDGYLILSDVNGRFRGATIDSDGNFVPGERVIQVGTANGYSGLLTDSNVSSTGVRELNVGVVSGDPQRETVNRTTYNQTFRVNTVGIDSNPSLFDENSVSYLSLDSTLRILQLVTGTAGATNAEYSDIGTASVVNYTVQEGGGTQEVYLELTSARGWNRTFPLFDQSTKQGILIGFGSDENGQPQFLFEVAENPDYASPTPDVTKPDLKIGSGEVVYIDNTRAIIRNPERLEEFKLILRF